MLQILVITCIVAGLYIGYFIVQSTEMEYVFQVGLNLSLSTAWGILLEFLNWIIFYKLACALNTFENHRTAHRHENRLIAKIFIFFFIDSYLWFYLLAFFHIPFGRQIDAFLQVSAASMRPATQLAPSLSPLPPPPHPRRRAQDSLGVQFDKAFEKSVWMARLSNTVGAVLGVTQWMLVYFTDAYFPLLVKAVLSLFSA